MVKKSLETHFNAFKRDYKNVVGKLKPYHAFTAFCAKYFYYSDSSEDLDEGFLDRMPDGARDGGIDAVFANPNPESNELVILQGKFYKKSKLELSDLKAELNKIIDTVNDLRAHKVKKLNDDVKAAFFSAVDELESEDFKIRIDFCTFFEPTKKRLGEYQKVCADKAVKSGFQIRFLSYEEIQRQVISCETATITIPEYVLKIDAPKNALHYGKSVVVNVSAHSIQKLYQAKQEKVLGLNLRYHIKGGGQIKDVDIGLGKTIESEPNNFWYLNNGILIACDNFLLSGTDLKLTNFSIINGGQTTFKIANSDIPNDFYVQCKVIVAEGRNEAERNKFCLKIAQATNSQKPIKPADLRSNEPEQALLKKNLNALGFYYVTKAGDKPPRGVYRNYQITNLDKVGKVSLAGVLLMPGTARANPAKMFTDAEIYAEIFEKPHPNMITDLLMLSYYYKTFQRKAIAHPENFGFDDEDHIPAIQNGERYYLACISFLAKVKSQVFAIPAVKRERAKGDENLRMLLWKCGDMEKIVEADGDVGAVAEKVFTLLTKKVVGNCCKQARKAAKASETSYAHANYLKKDETFTRDMINELWSVYMDDDDPLKAAMDALIG